MEIGIAEFLSLLIFGGVCIYIGRRWCEKDHWETFEWCTDCKEYDQKNYCCHRWSKVIRQTRDEMKVVRCGECIHIGDPNYCPMILRTHDYYDFCSLGERKEE